MLKISVIIMAAGFSKRMKQNKLLLTYENQTFLERTLHLVQQLSVYETILVLSNENQKYIEIPSAIKLVSNKKAELGQSASVALGTERAKGDGYLYLPIDQPLLTADLLNELFPHYTEDKIIFPVHEDGQPSSPIFFGKKFRNELLRVTGESGGREVRFRHPEALEGITVKNPKLLVDIDTPEEYQQLLQAKMSEERTQNDASFNQVFPIL